MLAILQRLPLYMGDPCFLRLTSECPGTWRALVSRGFAKSDETGYLRLTAKGRDTIKRGAL
jgi:hypothetical protein